MAANKSKDKKRTKEKPNAGGAPPKPKPEPGSADGPPKPEKSLMQGPTKSVIKNISVLQGPVKSLMQHPSTPGTSTASKNSNQGSKTLPRKARSPKSPARGKTPPPVPAKTVKVSDNSKGKQKATKKSKPAKKKVDKLQPESDNTAVKKVHVPVMAKTINQSTDCPDSDKDNESANHQKKKAPVKVAVIKLKQPEPAKTDKNKSNEKADKIEEDETLNSVDGEMPELALPSYCLPEGEFEEPDALGHDDKKPN